MLLATEDQNLTASKVHVKSNAQDSNTATKTQQPVKALSVMAMNAKSTSSAVQIRCATILVTSKVSVFLTLAKVQASLFLRGPTKISSPVATPTHQDNGLGQACMNAAVPLKV